MAYGLTFGVEFEFCLATIKNPKWISAADDYITNRTVWIEPTTKDRSSEGLGEDDPPSLSTIQLHIARTLHDVGFPADLEHPWDESATKWTVKYDGSIREPEWIDLDMYHWHGIEITSPAFYYSENSIEHVRTFCSLMKLKYLVNVNESTGLHVHIGNGNNKFSDQLLRNLLAFFWAFEPQLKTLHRPYRQENGWCQSLRTSSNFTWEFARALTFRNQPERFPTGAEGVMHFLRERLTVRQILQDSQPPNMPRCAAYNFANFLNAIEDNGVSSKLTLEFRQHEGSLDEEAVTNWVRVCAGIVDFARKSEVSPLNFASLLEVVAYDRRRPLAEHGFTVIQLLRKIGQARAAEFYKGRGLWVVSH